MKKKGVEVINKLPGFLRVPLKWFIYLCICAAFILFGVHISLQYLLPLDSVKNTITGFISSYTGMEASVSGMRAGLFGLQLSGVTLGDESGPLLSVQEARVLLSPLKLLRGDISVIRVSLDGFALFIIREADGSLNIESVFGAPSQNEPEEDAPAGLPFNLLVKHLQMTNSVVNYIDKGQDIKLKADRLFVDIQDFSPDNPFRVSVNGQLSAAVEGAAYNALPFGFTLHPDLNNFDIAGAAADIKPLALKAGGAEIIVSGNVRNFLNPDMNLSIQLRNLSEKAFEPLAELPAFNIPLVKILAAVKLDTAKMSAVVRQLDIDLLSSLIKTTGIVSLGDKLLYNLKTDADITLDGFGEAVALLNEFKLKGKLNALAEITPQNIAGSADITDLSLFTNQAGDLHIPAMHIEAADIRDIKIPPFSAQLNKNVFTAGLSYLNKGQHANIDFSFKADKLFVKISKKLAAEMDKEQVTQDDVLNSAGDLASSSVLNGYFDRLGLPPVTVKADVEVKNLDSHFLSGSDISLKGEVTGITSSFDKLGGGISLSAAKGQIKDLYRLTNANALTKVLFLSLTVASKVINSLKVLDLLKAIGAAVVPGHSGQPAAAAVANEDDKVEQLGGKLDYSSFKTRVDFKNEKSFIKYADFASDKLSFSVTGDINFATQAIKMNVKAAPGNVSRDGIMPILIKVEGTLSEPKGSMAVLGSAASLVSQAFLNNPASNLLKKGAGALGGLIGIGGKAKKGAAAPEPAEDEYIFIDQPQNASDAAADTAQTAGPSAKQ